MPRASSEIACMLIAPKRLLDHLKEAAFFSPKDLESISGRLQECRDYCERGKDSYSPHLLTLLDARIEVCQSILSELELSLSHLTPELRPKYDKLVSILRSLSACNTRSKVWNWRTYRFHTLLTLKV